MKTKVRRGRPRITAIDSTILDAAADLMGQRGYRGMTVGAVATAAGVSEPTVYLRYPTKYELAVAAIARRPFLQHPADTGDVTEDLIALLTDLVATAEAIGLGIIGVVLAEEPEHPELLARWRATVGSAARRVVEEVIERGRGRGQVREGVHSAMVADLIMGAFLAHYTHEGPPDGEWARDVVETLRPSICAWVGGRVFEWHPVLVPTVYEAAGGTDGLVALAGAWHARVLADEVVSHAFSHGYDPEHTERLAAYWVEALGGPALYSERYGDETAVVRIHSGNGPHDEMDRRAIACFDQALIDVGLAGDERLRQALHDYFEWATTTTMARYHDSADDVPEGLRIPHWSWDGLCPVDPTY